MRDALWTGKELASVFGTAVGDALAVRGVAIDSRDVQAGDLFIALAGTANDGHDFVAQAFANGAAAALVREGDKDDARLIFVEDTQEALRALARQARARTGAKITAITGSVGKTGVKNRLAVALAESGRVHASEKSFNNHVGVPLSLARMPRDADYGVFELGMNHAGEIAGLVALVQPHLALITTVGAAHIGMFDSEADIARAKAEIFSGLEAGKGIAIVPADNPHSELLCASAEAAGARVLTFAKSGDADAYATQVVARMDCSCVAARIGKDEVTLKIASAGAHHITNALAILLAVQALGGDLALGALALGRVQAEAGRGACHRLALKGGAVTLIDESYNANPVSMRAALATLGATTPDARGRRIAVLGDMAELGTYADALHKALADDIATAQIDCLFTIGALMESLHKRVAPPCVAEHSTSIETLSARVLEALRPDDIVMVKGSNAVGLATVVGSLLAYEASEEKSYAV